MREGCLYNSGSDLSLTAMARQASSKNANAHSNRRRCLGGCDCARRCWFSKAAPKGPTPPAQGRPHCGVRTKTRNQHLRVAWTARQSHSAQLRLRWAFAQGIMRAILRSCAKEAERRRLQPRKITTDDWTSGTRSHTLQAAQLIHDAEGFSSRLQRPKPANPRPKRLTVSGAKRQCKAG